MPNHDKPIIGQPPRKRQVRRLGIDLTKCPRPWLPEALNTVTFTARVYECVDDNWVYPGPPTRITFTLHDVSREQGICLNKGSSRNPDLWFPRQPDVALTNDASVDSRCERAILGTANPAHRHYQRARTNRAVTEFTITVRSEDYGAWGWIEATADGYLEIPPREPGSAVACRAGSCCTGSNRVKAPRDDNGNNIADSTPQDDNGAPATNDQDASPAGDGHNGDGLSNYEEYRGFMTGDVGKREAHVRTDLHDKDVFIWDKDDQGVGHFWRSGFALHFVRWDHLGGPDQNEINFNRGYATNGPQHGLKLVYGRLQGLLGECQGGPGVPKDISWVVIDRWAHTSRHDIRNTRAHELAHGVNVWHHGQLALIQGRIDPLGGLTSGDVDCIMRYDNYAYAWRWPAPQQDYPIGHGSRHIETAGTTFCSSNLGTGVNAQGARNNTATRGNCSGQFRVNDH